MGTYKYTCLHKERCMIFKTKSCVGRMLGKSRNLERKYCIVKKIVVGVALDVDRFSINPKAILKKAFPGT